MPTLTVDCYPIAYAEAGSGTPVVMVHGTLGDQRSFAGQMEAFGAQYHAVSISLRHC
jgi:pimeloyl-ACP methyl ester carboxylesterase